MCDVSKLLSEDPRHYDDAPTEGIRRVLSRFTGVEHPRGVPLDTSRIRSIRMGTTVATNALLERKGERCVLVTTRGFADLLHIGTQSRDDIFDLAIAKRSVLFERVVEVDERVVLDLEPSAESPTEVGATGELVRVLRSPDETTTKDALREALACGIRSAAIVFMHSYTFRRHEELVAEWARQLGFTHVSVSSAVMPMVKMVSRYARA